MNMRVKTIGLYTYLEMAYHRKSLEKTLIEDLYSQTAPVNLHSLSRLLRLLLVRLHKPSKIFNWTFHQGIVLLLLLPLPLNESVFFLFEIVPTIPKESPRIGS